MPLQPVMGLQQASQQDKAALQAISSSRPPTSLCRLAGTAAQSCACP